MKTIYTPQQRYFHQLNDVILSPIYTAKNWRQGQQFTPGKQKLLGTMLPPLDHRSIGSNEVVIELDAKSFSLNSRYAHMISNYLTSQEIPHYNFWSGNKSIHMHIFLEDVEIKSKENIETIKKAMKSGWSLWKSVRLAFAKEIVEQSGINADQIGHGKLVDLAKLSWDDIHKTCLIRCCGGSNKKIDQFENITTTYKTFLSKIPNVKPSFKSRPMLEEDIVYPDKLETYLLSESFIVGLAEKYLSEIEKNSKRKEITNINYEGKYINLPCIRKMLEGMPHGKRSFAAQQIAIASRLDGNDIKKTKEIIQTYIDNCSQGSEPFEGCEGFKWVDWVYSQKEAYFACGLSQKLGSCEIHSCEYNKEKYKDDLRIFEDDEPLTLIKKALDETIVGEDLLKVQLFLIYLTKAFDPEWCVILDSPASSGKTHIMKAVADLFGDKGEGYFIYSRLTGAVLNRLSHEAEKWQDKIVIIEEIQGTKQALEQLRVLISERELSLLETIESKNPDGSKKLEAKETKVQLKNTIFATCQAEIADEGDQLRTRAWILNTDQTEHQTKKIIEYTLRKEFDSLAIPKTDLKDKIRAGLGALITPHAIDFPFYTELINMFPYSNMRGRRDIKKFVSLVKSSAYFHQNNRRWYKDKKGKNVLIADWRDVEVILKYAWDTLVSIAQGLGATDLKFLEEIDLKANMLGTEFTVDDVMRWCNLNLSATKKLMSLLSNEGFVENTTRPPEKAKYKRTALRQMDIKMDSSHSSETVLNSDVLESWVNARSYNSSTKP